MAFLTAENIKITRGGQSVLDGADLTIAAQDRLLLLGASGSGKTTLLSVLAGLLQPDSGRVMLDKDDFYALSQQKRDRLRGRNFGFVFQTLHLIPYLTVRQNIALASVMAGLPVDQDRVDSLLDRLGLADKAQRKPAALSQGEAQRAAIARAVLNRPRLIVADEPTSALDDANAKIVTELLVEQARETGAALLVATHDGRIGPYFEKTLVLDRAKVAA